MLDQLTLGIRLHDEANFQSFYVADNGELISSLKNLLESPASAYIYIGGVSASGKSHLLQACCQYTALQGLSAIYLPLNNPDFSPLILEDLDNFFLVCIDNIEAIVGVAIWEDALFHFFNRSIQKKTRLLIAGNSIPQQLAFKLPDLASRLASGLTYWVKILNDEQKLAALQLRAHLRGFGLTEEVGRYLLTHYPRDLTILFQVLEFLDHASLEAKHRLTLPFVKTVLAKYPK